MPEDLTSLKHSLESSTDRPSFDRIADRADCVRRRRRARRSVAAVGLAAAAIVVSAVIVTTGPGESDPPVAGGGDDDNPLESFGRTSPTHQVKGGTLNAAVPLGGRGSEDSETVTVDITASATQSGDAVRYKASLSRLPSGAWTRTYAVAAGANGCDTLQVTADGSTARIAAPRGCAPAESTATRWTIVAKPGDGSGASWSAEPVEFVTRPDDE